MKRFKTTITLLIGMICFALTALAAACSRNTPPVPIDLDTLQNVLDAPQNVRVEDNKLMWDEVENAWGYAVYLFEEKYETGNNYIDFSFVDFDITFDVEVLAIGDGVKYLDSDRTKYSCTLKKPFDPTYGYTYQLTDDGTGYAVSLGDKLPEKELYIPDYYEGLPVKEIKAKGFSRIGHESISNTFTTSIRLPSTLEKIGEKAFANYLALKSLVIPEGVKIIENEAFANCGAASITLPSTLEEIYVYPFRGAALTFLNVAEGAKLVNGFQDCKNLREVQLPSTLKFIQSNAFTGCTALSKINLPKGVTVCSLAFWGCTSLRRIDCSECAAVQTCAFYQCSALREITFPKDISTFTPDAVAETAWYENQPDGFIIANGDTLLHYKGDVANEGVIDSFPSQIKYIAESAFYARFGLWDLFSESNLVSIAIPDSVKLLGEDIFRNCKLLKQVRLPNDLTAIPAGTFAGCRAIEAVTISEGVTEIGDSAFDNCESLSKVNLPSALKVIGQEAFDSCSALKSITIPEGAVIGEYAFSGCTSLTEVNLPSTLKEIPKSAFSACLALQSITIPEGVTKIGDGAFYNCRSLTEINLPSTLKEVGSLTFWFCNALTKIYFPAGVETAGKNLMNMTLEEIILPVTLNTIPERCFNENTKIFYYGTEEDWNTYFSEISYAGTRYYFVENEKDVPLDGGNYWHFASDGTTPVAW